MDNNMIEYDLQAKPLEPPTKVEFLKVHREFEETFSWHCYRNTFKIHETVSVIKRK